MSAGESDLRVLHDQVDRRAADLAGKHAGRMQCRQGCHDCCVDDLTVFEVEADAIRLAYPELLTNGAPHASGKCAFLDSEGACRIYPHRPYVCRTQGLPLRWIADGPDDELVEYRDICPLNEADGPPLTELTENDCWTLGPWEGQLAGLQERHGNAGERVSLRSLFTKRD